VAAIGQNERGEIFFGETRETISAAPFVVAIYFIDGDILLW